jgi:hypothetical protein
MAYSGFLFEQTNDTVGSSFAARLYSLLPKAYKKKVLPGPVLQEDQQHLQTTSASSPSTRSQEEYIFVD